MERFGITYTYGTYRVAMSDGRVIKINANSEYAAVAIILKTVCNGAPVSAVKSCKLLKRIPL